MSHDNQLPLFESPLNDADPIKIPDQWKEYGKPESTEQDEDEYCASILAEIVVAYEKLRAQLGTVAGRIWVDGRAGLPAKMMDHPGDDSLHAREHAIAAISNWAFEEGQAPNETPSYVGAISSSPDTLAAIKELNRLKDSFKDLVGKLRQSLEPQTTTRGEMVKLLNMVTKASPRIMRSKEVGSLVRGMLHPKLNIRQLQRTIPVCDQLPLRIRWRWMSSPSSKQINRAELMQLLERKGEQGYAKMDLAKIFTVSDDRFVLRRKTVKDLRIHITLSEGESEAAKFADFKSRLPLFYHQAEQGYWRQEPELIVIPENAPVFERKKRVDPEPFLMSLPVHRYLDAPGSD
jgi:hypothetical protein